MLKHEVWLKSPKGTWIHKASFSEWAEAKLWAQNQRGYMGWNVRGVDEPMVVRLHDGKRVAIDRHTLLPITVTVDPHS